MSKEDKINVGEGWFQIDPDPKGPDWPKSASDEWFSGFTECWVPVDMNRQGFNPHSIYRRRIEPTTLEQRPDRVEGESEFWTSEIPKEHGWYFWRIAHWAKTTFKCVMVHISEEAGDTTYFERIGQHKGLPLDYHGNDSLWHGPLTIGPIHGTGLSAPEKPREERMIEHYKCQRCGNEETVFNRSEGERLHICPDEKPNEGGDAKSEPQNQNAPAAEDPKVRTQKATREFYVNVSKFSGNVIQAYAQSDKVPTEPTIWDTIHVREVLPVREQTTPAASSDAYGFEEWWNHWLDEDDPALTSAARVEKWAKVASKDAYTFQQAKIDALQLELNKANADLVFYIHDKPLEKKGTDKIIDAKDAELTAMRAEVERLKLVIDGTNALLKMEESTISRGCIQNLLEKEITPTPALNQRNENK